MKCIYLFVRGDIQKLSQELKQVQLAAILILGGSSSHDNTVSIQKSSSGGLGGGPSKAKWTAAGRENLCVLCVLKTTLGYHSRFTFHAYISDISNWFACVLYI